jgi:hypothetical protein
VGATQDLVEGNDIWVWRRYGGEAAFQFGSLSMKDIRFDLGQLL